MNDQSKEIMELVSKLKENNSVLMVGAGLSRFLGYPLWRELADNLRNEFYSTLTINEDSDLDLVIGEIKEFAEKNGRANQFYNYIEDTFESKAITFSEYHLKLLELGFCGVVTTNYDVVLENAMTNFFKKDNEFYSCQSKDLCSGRKYPIIKSLRSISSKKITDDVLHLHGIYANPMKMIITREDYLLHYGDSIQKAILGQGNKQINLETFHTKVIWSLLASYNFLFVGFSLSDPFFFKILETVNYDFDNPIVMHYAIMHYQNDEDQDKISGLLKPLGVQPIFYHVPQEDPTDHKNLDLLLSDLIRNLKDSREESEGIVVKTEESEGNEVKTEESSVNNIESVETVEPGVESISTRFLE